MGKRKEAMMYLQMAIDAIKTFGPKPADADSAEQPDSGKAYEALTAAEESLEWVSSIKESLPSTAASQGLTAETLLDRISDWIAANFDQMVGTIAYAKTRAGGEGEPPVVALSLDKRYSVQFVDGAVTVVGYGATLQDALEDGARKAGIL